MVTVTMAIEKRSLADRRLAKDFEASINSARAFLYAASVMLLSRHIGSSSKAPR